VEREQDGTISERTLLIAGVRAPAKPPSKRLEPRLQ
jgi:hypothetical protein